MSRTSEQDLTREPEMVSAYRDTWHLGVHSYLSYLRDRFIVAKELLADTGSIFVQISDENVHRVSAMLGRGLWGRELFVLIPFTKTGGQRQSYLPDDFDYLLW